jgi:hypothetical protein
MIVTEDATSKPARACFAHRRSVLTDRTALRMTSGQPLH